MRLRELRLMAVGPFADQAIDLEGGHYGLHLIVGPNEAGKTSTLRALRYLLFGFPAQVPEAIFRVGAYEKLRVGGVLENGSGRRLEVVRRKAAKNTLRGGDDAALVEDAELSRLLGGLDAESFAQLFGIDHAGLRQAGEQVRKGKGRFGELLFSAAAGLQGLRDVQRRLDEEMSALFKPQGRIQRIPQALADLKALEQTCHEACLPHEEWVRHDESLASAHAEAARIERELAALRAEHGRLDRIRLALPQLGRFDALRERLDGLAGAPRLRPEFADDLRASLEAEAQAGRDGRLAGEQETEIASALGALVVPEAILAARDEVGEMVARLGQFQKAQKDRPGREGRVRMEQHAARELLQELGRPRHLDPDAIEALRLRADEATIIPILGNARGELVARVDEAAAALARHDRAIARLESERAGLPDGPPDLAPIAQAVRQARKAGDLENLLADERRKLRQRETAALQALQALPDAPGSLDALAGSRVPLDATVARHAADWDQADRKADAAAMRLAEQRAALRARADALRLLEAAHGSTPTEAALRALRDERDRLWRRIRDNEPAEFAAYEQSVLQADDMADRLRREADRVAQHAQEAEALRQAGERLAAGEAESAAAESARDEARRRWSAQVIGPLGLPDLSPTELAAWLARRGKVLDLAEKRREPEAEIERRTAEIDAHRARLNTALAGAGHPPAPADCPLAEALDRAEGLVAEAHALRQKTQEVDANLARERLDRDQAEARRQAAAAELDAWRRSWSPRMARLGLEPDALPDQALLFLDRIRKLFEALGNAREDQSRIDGIDRDGREFRADLAALARRLAPEHEAAADGDPAPVARALEALLREAEGLAERRRGLIEQRARIHERIERARLEARGASDRLDALAREAGCAGPFETAEARAAALAARAEQARQRAQVETELAECTARLEAHGGGATAEKFAAELRSVEPDTLGPRCHAIAAEIERLEAERTGHHQAIGRETGWLAQQTGAATAADRAEEHTLRQAQLRDDLVRYARLKLASAALRRGIDRYRQNNQEPVLTRAGELFRRLTVGSFADLRLDYDDNGQSTVLKGLRPDDTLVGVEGMSDGSHDQLYLALRLASLEHWLKAHDPIPFVVDDILLNFDDARSTAALGVLGELSQKTQVLMFTHHDHLVDLATKALPPDVLFVRRLGGG